MSISLSYQSITSLIRRILPHILIVGILFLYLFYVLKQEAFFYVWDMENYYNLTIEALDAWRQSNLLSFIHQTLTEAYNAMFSLPLLPWMLFFGESRITFIMLLFFVYAWPCSFMLAKLMARSADNQSRHIFWLSYSVILLTPAFWMPLLVGMPDVGGMLLVTLAIYYYLKVRSTSNPFAFFTIAILLGFAVLFRRHFAYAGLSFLIAASIDQLEVHWLQHSKEYGFSILLKTGWFIAILGVGICVPLMLFSVSLAIDFLATNYNSLYSSYHYLISEVTAYYCSLFGAGLMLLASLGFYIAWRRKIFSAVYLRFILIMTCAWGCIWLWKVQQINWQFALHSLVFYYVTGITSVLSVLWACMKKNRRRLSLYLILLFCSFILIIILGISFLYGTSNLAILNNITQSKLSPLLSAKKINLVRSDYSEVIRLVDYLRKTVKSSEYIVVGSSSLVLNSHTLLSATKSQYGKNSQPLPIIVTGDIDSRDNIPLDALMRADYVVIALPFQYHIKPSEQKIQKVIVDAWQQHWAISKDFKLLPETFQLGENRSVYVYVYKRIRPISINTALISYRQFMDYVKYPSSRESPWLLLTGLGQEWDLRQSRPPFFSSGSILYSERVKGRLQISGKIGLQNCKHLRVRSYALSSSQKIMLKDTDILNVADGFFYKLDTVIPKLSALILQFNWSEKKCIINAGELKINGQPNSMT